MGLMVGDDLLCAEFISIHLPVGVGQIRKEIPLRRAIFQSTHPVRGGTLRRWLVSVHGLFQSTHPVRGGTPASPPLSRGRFYFNLPTPCGVGPSNIRRRDPLSKISIHPPRAGWDDKSPPSGAGLRHFNPPPPCGVGPRQIRSCLIQEYFNPPTPCGVGL